MRFKLILTASSMVARQPCMDDKPYLSLSFSPSSENFSVLGVLRYIPISIWNQKTLSIRNQRKKPLIKKNNISCSDTLWRFYQWKKKESNPTFMFYVYLHTKQEKEKKPEENPNSYKILNYWWLKYQPISH